MFSPDWSFHLRPRMIESQLIITEKHLERKGHYQSSDIVPGACVEALRNMTEYFNYDGQYPSRYLNQRLSTYTAGVLPTAVTISVCVQMGTSWHTKHSEAANFTSVSDLDFVTKMNMTSPTELNSMATKELKVTRINSAR